MNKLNLYAAFVVISGLVVSCTITKPITRSGQVTPQSSRQESSQNIKAEELTIDTTRVPLYRNSERNWSEIVASAEDVEEYENLDGIFNSFSTSKSMISNFTNSEIENVGSVAYNPFGSNDYIYLDLRKMQKEFEYPVKNGKLISNYGMRGRRMHSGIDIKASPGENVYAAFDGIVRLSKPYSGYGNVIVIRHANGLETVYSHNSRNLVRSGDVVSKGDVIARAGRTGRASTEHVHFEVRVAGKHINPNLLVDTETHRLKEMPLYIQKRGSSILASNKRMKDKAPVVAVAAMDGDDEDSEDEISTTSKPEVKHDMTDKEAPKIVDKPAESQSSGAVYHAIVSGNTLGVLAKKYNTTVEKICKLNNIKPTTTLQLKQKIRVK